MNLKSSSSSLFGWIPSLSSLLSEDGFLSFFESLDSKRLLSLLFDMKEHEEPRFFALSKKSSISKENLPLLDGLATGRPFQKGLALFEKKGRLSLLLFLATSPFSFVCLFYIELQTDATLKLRVESIIRSPLPLSETAESCIRANNERQERCLHKTLEIESSPISRKTGLLSNSPSPLPPSMPLPLPPLKNSPLKNLASKITLPPKKTVAVGSHLAGLNQKVESANKEEEKRKEALKQVQEKMRIEEENRNRLLDAKKQQEAMILKQEENERKTFENIPIDEIEKITEVRKKLSEW